MLSMRRAHLFFLLLLTACSSAGLSSTQMHKYSWLQRCDAQCMITLGEERVNFIDTQSCTTLPEMLKVQHTKNQEEWNAIVQDKMDDLVCEGSAVQKSGKAPEYVPQFNWQKKCLRDCANILGTEKMSEIDKWNCEYMEIFIPDARNPRRYSDYSQNADWYDEWAKAVLDKAAVMSC
jgi:hypothetical protein